MSTMKIMSISLFFLFLLGISAGPVSAIEKTIDEDSSPSRLLIVWTSGDKEVAMKMVHMYAFNAKKNKWWDTVRLLIWGPSQKLVAEDADIQEYIKKMKDIGIELYACKGCADLYGIADKVAAQGVTVKYTGMDLTEWIKAGWTTITF